MTDIADEITTQEAPNWTTMGGKRAAVFACESAIRTLRNPQARFKGDPSEEEREEWVTVHQAELEVLAGKRHKDDAALLEARVGSRWWLAAKNVDTSLPSSEATRTEITRHMGVQERNREARETRQRTGQPGTRPSDDEVREAMLVKSQFDHWWLPIEDHQRAAERWFLMLFRFGGGTEDAERQQRILHRGRNVNQRIRNSMDDGRIPWLPRFRHFPAPCDNWWHRELFGGKVSATMRDVTRWWEMFEEAVPRFTHAAPTVPFGLGDGSDGE